MNKIESKENLQFVFLHFFSYMHQDVHKDVDIISGDVYMTHVTRDLVLFSVQM